jgi:hypothetical protein
MSSDTPAATSSKEHGGARLPLLDHLQLQPVFLMTDVVHLCLLVPAGPHLRPAGVASDDRRRISARHAVVENFAGSKVAQRPHDVVRDAQRREQQRGDAHIGILIAHDRENRGAHLVRHVPHVLVAR